MCTTALSLVMDAPRATRPHRAARCKLGVRLIREFFLGQFRGPLRLIGSPQTRGAAYTQVRLIREVLRYTKPALVKNLALNHNCMVCDLLNNDFIDLLRTIMCDGPMT